MDLDAGRGPGWESHTRSLSPAEAAGRYGYLVADFETATVHLPSCGRLTSRPPAQLGWLKLPLSGRVPGLDRCRSCLGRRGSPRGGLRRLTLGSEARRTLEDLLAESADRFEICALAVGERAPAEEVLATDVRPLPARIRGRYWFAVEAGDYRRAVAQVEAARMAVVALVHSHPTPDLRPSLGDRMLLRATGLPQLIVARRGGGGVAAGCYALHGSRIEPVEVAVAGRSQ